MLKAQEGAIENLLSTIIDLKVMRESTGKIITQKIIYDWKVDCVLLALPTFSVALALCSSAEQPLYTCAALALDTRSGYTQRIPDLSHYIAVKTVVSSYLLKEEEKIRWLLRRMHPYLQAHLLDFLMP